MRPSRETDEEGVQENNLTMEEENGLTKLQKRVKDGYLVVVKTEKSGRFSVISMEEYDRSGTLHIKNDVEMNLSLLQENQRRLNGYLLGCIKYAAEILQFKVGSQTHR